MLRPVSLVLLLSLGLSVVGRAQATRTWVSGVGDDANPCSRTAPCATFAGAWAKTTVGGEIDVLDPGEFGDLTITHSIIIGGGGEIGGMLAGAGTASAFTINGGSSDYVLLTGLTLNAVGSSGSAINFVAGGTLVVEDCVILGAGQSGIAMTPTSGGGTLYVRGGSIRGNADDGILVASSNSRVRAMIERTALEGNTAGLAVGSGGEATIYKVVLANNTQAGAIVAAESGAAELNIEHSTIANNGFGIIVQGLGTGVPTVRTSNTVLSGNAAGPTSIWGAGVLDSYGNNDIPRAAGATCASGYVQVAPATLIPGTVGRVYFDAFSATGALGSVTFTESGSLPSGITDTNGLLLGIPTQQGQFPISVSATDSNGCTGSETATLSIQCTTITVGPTPPLPIGMTGVNYTETFTATGGYGAETYAISAGSLPVDLSLGTNGQISGYPTEPGTFMFTVTATDSAGCQGSASYNMFVNQSAGYQATTLTLMPSATTVVSGSSLMLTATLDSAAASAATGTVSFSDGTTQLGTGAVSNGIATLTTPLLGAGTHTLTAVYSGDRTYGSSENTAMVQVTAAPTETVLTSSGPSYFGESVTFTATVTSTEGTPTGAVEFLDGTTSLGTATLDGAGVATFETSMLTVGMDSITATYEGSPDFATSTSTPPLTQSVAPATFTVAVAVKPKLSGTTATAQILVNVHGDLGAPITFACTGQPSTDNCSFNPSTVAATEGMTTVTVTISSAHAMLGPLKGAANSRVAYGLVFPVLLLGMSRRRLRRGFMVGVVLAGLSLGACSPKPYNVTVVATSGTTVVKTVLDVPG